MVGKNRALLRLFALLLTFTLVAAACGGDDDSGDDNATEATDGAADGDGDGGDGGDGEEPAPEPEPADDGEATDDNGDGDGISTTIDESGEEAQFGGVLRVGLEADVDGLNPTGSALSAPGLTMGNAVFDTLSAIDVDGNWVPYLAESFTPSADFTSWEVKLRPGLTFHDGTPVDSAALQANFEVVIADPLVGLAVAPFYPPVDEGAFEIVDDLTARYNLLDPNAQWPTAVSGQLGMLASPTWLAASAEDPTLNQAPVGTGPFKFDSRSEDSVTRFVRNDDWWGGDVYLDAIEFVPVTDSDVRTNLLLEGDLNMLQTTNPTSILRLVEAEADGFQNLLSDESEESFAMINSAAPPFDDIRAREALVRATPRDAYNAQINQNVTRPATQAFTEDSPFYNPNIVSLADTPDQAAPLVEAYCAEKGEETNPITGTTTCTDGKINIELQWSGPSVIQTQIADLLNEGWSPFFNVTFDELLQDAHIQQTAFGQYNVNTWRQFGATNPADDNVWLLCRTVGGISLNWPKFCDEDRDALLEQAWAVETRADQVPIMQEAWEKIAADHLYIFFNHTLWDYALAPGVNDLCSRTSPEGALLECQLSGRTFFSSAWLSE